MDVKFAAIALANQAIFLSANRSDFERVPGLWLETGSTSSCELPHQFPNRLAVLHQIDRPARLVRECHFSGVHAQVMEHRRGHVLRAERAIDRVLASGVGLADRLARSQSAAS